MNGIAPNVVAFAATVGGNRFGQLPDGTFGGAIGGDPRGSSEASCRGNIYDRTAAIDGEGLSFLRFCVCGLCFAVFEEVT